MQILTAASLPTLNAFDTQLPALFYSSPPGPTMTLAFWDTIAQSWVTYTPQSQIYAYTGTSPSFQPFNKLAPAIAYDPAGVNPTFNWNVTTQLWT